MTLNEKIMNFITTITNAYRAEENRNPVQKIELTNDNLTEDFTAMVYALNTFFNEVTGQGIDIIDFTHLLNKLAVQHLLENREVDDNE